MEEIEDESIHFIVTSPPWNLIKYIKIKGDLSLIEDKKEFFNELGKVWKECFRVLKPNCKLACIFEDIASGFRLYGHARETCLCGNMVESLEEAGFELFTRIIWHNLFISKNDFRYSALNLHAKLSQGSRYRR